MFSPLKEVTARNPVYPRLIHFIYNLVPMATDTHNDREKNKAKAMALVALAANKAEVPGVCPSDEEMAALVDGQSGEKELQGIWTHLASCEKCYKEWFFLKKNKKEAIPHGRLYFLSSFKKFRYIGTALAAATCIAVYLNIVTMEDKVVEQRVAAPQAILLQNKNLAVPPSIPPSTMRERQEATKVTEPALSPTPHPAAPAAFGSGKVKGRLEPPQQLPNSSTLKPQEVPEKRAFTSGHTERKVVKDMASDAALSPTENSTAPAAAPAREDDKIFLAELQAACLAGRSESQFWADIVVQGLRLKARQSSTQTWPEQEKLSVVLALAQGINGPDTVPQQCRMILAELAKESENR